MSCQDAANLLEGKSPRAASLRVITVAVMLMAMIGLLSDKRLGKFCDGAIMQKDSQFRTSHSVVNPDDNNQQQQQQELPPIHVLFGLSGNHSGFFAEFQVALKSVLLNAPHYQDLHIHIMTDQAAYDYLPTVWNETGIDGAVWWRNITIIPYNVEPFIPAWTKIVQNSTKLNGLGTHTFGAYFRLFAHKVMPKDVGYALYMDTDVAFLSNLEGVFQYPPKNPLETSAPLCIISKSCDGFMFVNIRKLDQFWERVSSIKWTNRMNIHGDQSLVFRVGEKYEGSVAILPKPWSVTMTEIWRNTKNKETFAAYQPELGYVHFNGGGSSKEAYWESKDFLKKQFQIGLPATFYSELPWTWARFMGKGPGELNNTGIRIQGSINSTTFIHRVPTNTTLGFHTRAMLEPGRDPWEE